MDFLQSLPSLSSCFFVNVCVCSPPQLPGQCLEELVINPHQQQMEPFNWVMDWEGMLSPSSLASLLDKHFFKKWFQVSAYVQNIMCSQMMMMFSVFK